MTIRLSGTLTCNASELETVRSALPEQIRLSRAEPGCLEFEIRESAPGVFNLSEEFMDQAAFEAHLTRTRASTWWQLTAHMPRNFKVSAT